MISQTTPSATTTMEQELDELFELGDDYIGRLRHTGRGRVFILSGPSGVGKDSVLEHLQVAYPSAKYVVTSTSREMRDGEKDGQHYVFLNRETFERQIAAGEYIESEEVYGNLYGVPRQPILDGLSNGQHVIIKVDVKGAATLRGKIRHTVSIFLAPESMQSLLKRLRDRKTDKQKDLMKRFHTSSEELKRASEFDYVVFNVSDNLDAAVSDICSIIDSEQRRIDPPEATFGSN